MIEVRNATSEDLPLLESMYLSEIEDHKERARKFAEDLVLRFRTIIAFQDGLVCGTVTWEVRGGFDDGVVEMLGLGVSEGFQRRGIATKLVDAMIKEATQFYISQGYSLRAVILFMEKSNETARKFYSANKFKEVAVVPSLYPKDDASIWTRHL